jgi:hypothetical protein
MNSSRTPAQDRTEVAHLERLRQQLSTDIEAMEQKEASLREYEQRLRLLVEHTHGKNAPEASTTQQYRFSNAPDRSDLDAEWEKYQRAHALLEAARRGLSDDRLAFKAREEQLVAREREVARREAWVKAREQELAAKPAPLPKPRTKPSFTVAARNLLRGKTR